MQRRRVDSRWVAQAWEAVGIVHDGAAQAPMQILTQGDDRETYLVHGLELELFADENEGYAENCYAPEPKVFVMWRMQDGRAMPVKASVSYAEGTRMFDSGESADGVIMPGEVQAWLAGYLVEHYQPRVSRRRGHG